jgi:hypothetical protein
MMNDDDPSQAAARMIRFLTATIKRTRRNPFFFDWPSYDSAKSGTYRLLPGEGAELAI